MMGTGDNLTGGSVSEKSAFLQGITGGIQGGSGYTGQNEGDLMQVTVGSGGPGNAPAPTGSIAGYHNPVPKGVRPERIDQGVDFAGNGPLLAIGDATIGETSGGGWPGGPYMSYQLTSGPDSGKWVYYAENIRPTVRPGQQVKAGDTIAQMFDGGTGIEIGWATPGGGSPLSQSAQAGGIGGGDLPGGGENPTAVGKSFDQLLVALGAPKAPNFNNPVGGKLPAGYAKGGDIEVHHAHKTVQPPPYEFTYSTLHPVYAGGNDLLPSNTQIVLHFKANSIEFEVPPGAATDTGSNDNSTMAQAQTLVNTTTLNTAISKGMK